MKESLNKILGREEHQNLISLDGKKLKFNRVLITGSEGSLGKELILRLENTFNGELLKTDILGDSRYLDVTNPTDVKEVINDFQPDLIFHLAGAKHAPEGEVDTWRTLEINTIGTKYILESIAELNNECKLVLASTCKAANPEVVYGASKLISERMVLNSGGSVARFFNVIETAGNVFEIWSKIPENSPIEVASVCERHFISLGESIGLLIYTAISEPGRFIVNSSALLKISDVADRLYPNRKKTIINPRRGDRISEKFLSSSESIVEYQFENSIIKVGNIHDHL